MYTYTVGQYLSPARLLQLRRLHTRRGGMGPTYIYLSIYLCVCVYIYIYIYIYV